MEEIRRTRRQTTREVTTEVIGFDDDEDFKIIKQKTDMWERDHWIDRKLAYLFLKEEPVSIYIVSSLQAKSCYKLQSIVSVIKNIVNPESSLHIIKETSRCFKTKEGKEIRVIVNMRDIQGKVILLIQNAAYVKDEIFTKVIYFLSVHSESRIILTND